MEELQKEYLELLSSFHFDESNLDYTLLDKHRVMLTELAKVSNSGITVFDTYQKTHVFASYNFIDLFGYCVDGIDDRIPHEDSLSLFQNAIVALKYLFSNKVNVKDFKMISEYRMRNASNSYVRVVEQLSTLETDKAGNPWLSLSVIDLSPDQTEFKSVKCNIVNLMDNTFFSIQDLYSGNKETELTPREVEILRLIKDGLLSKEISDRLFISVHTVNTHRQRILEKLDADNSMEAVKYASSLGLLS